MPEIPNFTVMEERKKAMYQEKKIMLKMAELLFQEDLITPMEKSKMVEMIRREERL